jgi:group I intron endonuclease
MQGIYYIENIKTLRRYYGSSFNIEKRLIQHQQDLKKEKHHNIQLQRCYNKYGNIFRYEVLEETNFISQKELLEYEQTFLDKNINGYNMAPANGGNILGMHPDKNQIRKKILKTHKETIKNMSENEKKKKFGRPKDKNGNWKQGSSVKICPNCNSSMGYYAKTCGKCRDRTKDNNPFYRKSHTEKTKAVLREKMSGANSWIKEIDPSKLPYTKQYVIEYPNGLLKEVHGLKTIAEEFNTSIANLHATINRIAQGKIPSRGTFKGIKIYEKK